jgi:hypothetical protein
MSRDADFPNHGGQIRACFRGTWHGVTGNIAARY